MSEKTETKHDDTTSDAPKGGRFRVKAGTKLAGHKPGDVVQLTAAQAVAWADRFEKE
jgi:hypothetical protein